MDYVTAVRHLFVIKLQPVIFLTVRRTHCRRTAPPEQITGCTIFMRHLKSFLSARRYASAGTSYGPVSVCLSICRSVTTRCSIKRDERVNLVLAWMFFPTSRRSRPTLCFKEIRVSTKIRVLLSGIFPETQDLENYCHGVSIVERAVNLARERCTLRA